MDMTSATETQFSTYKFPKANHSNSESNPRKYPDPITKEQT